MSDLKKKISVVITMIMILTMSIVAMASSTVSDGATKDTSLDGTEKATVNIMTSNVGDELYMMKVIDVTYDSGANEVEYAFNSFYASFFAAHPTVNTVDKYAALDEDGLKALYGELSAYTVGQVNWKTSASYNGTTIADGTAAKLSVSNVELGQYLVISGGNSNHAKVYTPVSVEVVPVIEGSNYVLYSSYDVNMKTTDATVTKDVENTVADTADGDMNTIGIGDVYTYKLNVTVPTYPEDATNKTFYIKDTFSAGITIVDGSVKVMDSSSNELPTNAYLVTISGQNMFIDFYYDQIATYSNLVITYDAVLNENAVVGTETGNANGVTLTYSNDPYVGSTYVPGTDPGDDPGNDPDRPDSNDPGYNTTDEDIEIVYTYGIYVDKYEDGNETTKLAGAVFNIYTDAPCTGTVVGTITTDANGIGWYDGLAAGTYYLKEMKAPTGYNKLADPITVIIDSTKVAWKVANTTTTQYEYTSDVNVAIIKTQAKNPSNAAELVWINTTTQAVEYATTQPAGCVAAYVSDIKTTTTATEDAASSGKEAVKVAVPNGKGNILPSAGGDGVMALYVIGASLVIVAVFMLVIKKCKNSKIS